MPTRRSPAGGELWELNRGRDFGGVTFANPSLIYAGGYSTCRLRSSLTRLQPWLPPCRPSTRRTRPPQPRMRTSQGRCRSGPGQHFVTADRFIGDNSVAVVNHGHDLDEYVPSSTAPSAMSAEPGPVRSAGAAEEETVSTLWSCTAVRRWRRPRQRDRVAADPTPAFSSSPTSTRPATPSASGRRGVDRGSDPCRRRPGPW